VRRSIDSERPPSIPVFPNASIWTTIGTADHVKRDAGELALFR